jgi:hypothetical protein
MGGFNFDMTIPLSKNIEQLLELMLKRNKSAKQWLNEYQIDYTEHIVRSTISLR